MSDNIKVVVKVRPLIPREIDEKLNRQWRVNNNTLYQLDQNGKEWGTAFTFEKVYDENTKTSDVYNDIAKPIVEAATAGFNGTIFAYGQTSSGKTYTMTGTNDSPGIIPLAVLNLFDIIKKIPDRDFLVRVSYVEIYNESLLDLLDKRKPIKICENFQGVKMDANERVTTSPEEVLEVMREGKANRQTGSTNMNEESSRSHSIFQITIESREHLEGEEEVGSVNVSQLNLVDLAGSERSGQTGATGIRFKEGTHINKSLSALALVIKQLSEGNSVNRHVNYRDSKLTRILQNSLGGNAKTSIICAVTPAAIEETVSTLQFANRAKAIKNTPAVNAVATDATMIQSLTKQLSTLKTQLESKKTIEQDNVKLHKEIQRLQKLILNGFAETSRRKPPQSRRVTISTLHPIQEDPAPTIPSFCTPSLKYNPLSLARVSEFLPLQSACSLPSVSEEPRMITPPPPDRKVKGNEVIELDSDDDDSSDVKTCSPYHKCYNSTKTPPCILRKTAKQAEKNLKDIVDFTEREKIYTPNIVELMEKLEKKSIRITELEEKLQKLSNVSKDKDTEMDKLKTNISRAEEQIEQINSAKDELEKACKDYKTKLTDWEVSFETLKKKSKTREDELLSRLQEHENKKKCEVIGKMSSMVIEKDLNFMDISRDISLVDSENDNSIISVKNQAQPPKIQDLLSQLSLKDQTILELETNLDVQKSRIDSLVNVNKELQDMISNYKEKVAYIENENSLHKSTIDNLNNTIENQKSMLESLKTDIESYNSVIQDFQLKLSKKDSKLMEISDTDLELMIANEEMFIANNENMKNIVQSLKIVLNQRNEEITHLKSAINNAHEPDIHLIDEVKNKQEEIITLKEDIEKLKVQENGNISLIDKLVQEKNNLLNIELQLKHQKKKSEIQKDKELLEKQNEQYTLEVADLKECNKKITAELEQKQTEIASNTDLRIQIENMIQKISQLEDDINAKEKIIKILNKQDEETHENIDNAKSALEKLQKIFLLFTADIINVPDIIDSLVTALNTLNDHLTSLESLASESIKEKNKINMLLEQREIELHNLQSKIEDLNNAIDSFNVEYHSNSEVSSDHHINKENDALDNLKYKLMNLMTTIKTTQTYLKQSLQNREKELDTLKTEYQNTKIDHQSKECNKNSEYLQEIQDIALKRDQLLQNILMKATHLTSEFNIENKISCQLNSNPENTYEEINLTLDKIANYIKVKSGHGIEQTNIEIILADAKNEIQRLTSENLKLLQDIGQLESSNTSLSKEIKTIQEDSKSLTQDLKTSNNLLNQLQQNLLTKSSEIELLHTKAEDCATKFKNIEISMKEQIDFLETENIELKSKCSEAEIQDKYMFNIKRDIKATSEKKDNSRKLDDIDLLSPPSLLTICCNRIIDAIQPNDDSSLSSISITNFKDNEYTKICRCEELRADIDVLKTDNNRLKLKIEELEKNNDVHLKEQEEVQNEVRLLLEHSHELQKKILYHRTNLSTLTATTYAENKSLSSQVKVLQHHHSRFHTVCERDIPDVKNQLMYLMTLLKSENFGKKNNNFKRFSLPNALDTTLHSTFKNESTIDGDLLMLDTNVTLTSCDNTIIGNEQTCFDITQICTYHEVACQTNFSEITKSDISTPQILTESLETFKMVETLESLKKENNRLRDLVEDYSKNQALKVKVTDAQSSPIKMVSSLNDPLCSPTSDHNTNVDSCGDCKHENEMKIVEEKFIMEITAMTKKLIDVESQKNELEEKFHNLTLEMPNTDLLMRKLGALENDLSKKQNEIDTLRESLNNKKKELENLQEENETLSNQVMESISEVDDLKKDHDLLKEKNNNLINKFSKLEQEIKHLKYDKNIQQATCSECLLKNEIIGTLETKLANSHIKLDRSYSDADSSSRYNKICTLQNELHAGKEDCIVLKEEVTTIKKHLERSNLSISHAMDLDESIGDVLMCSHNKDFAHLKSQDNKYAQNISEDQSTDAYTLEKIECVNYYAEKTGMNKETLNCGIKIIDIMKMLYDNFSAKHIKEIENLVNKLKDSEDAKNKLENQILKLSNEHARITKEFEEKDNYLLTMANVVAQVRNNLTKINEDIESENVVNIFIDKFLKTIDKELGFNSTIIFKSMMEQICDKYSNQIEKIFKENQQLKDEVQHMNTEVNSVNENLNTIKLQLAEKIKEIGLLKKQNEIMQEINSTVTMDMIAKEKGLNVTVANYYQKLLQHKMIEDNIDLSLPPLEILKLLFNHILTQCNKEKFEAEKINIVMEIDLLKKNLHEKDSQLQTLTEKLSNGEETNKKLCSNLLEKEQVYEDMIKVFQKKVEENDVNISTISKLIEEARTLRETIENKDAQIIALHIEVNTLSDKTKKFNEAKVSELMQSSNILHQEIQTLKSINEMILKEKETCADELKNACITIKEYKTNLEKLTSDIIVLKESVKEHSHKTETLRQESKALLEENKALQVRLQGECDNCNRLSNNIKTHERTAQIQSGMIVRLQKQKEDTEKELLERNLVVEELKEKCKCLELQCEVMGNDLKTSKEELEALTNAKNLLEIQISKLESEAKDKSELSIEAIAETARKRRQSIQDSKRMFADNSQDHAKLEAVFKSRNKGDDLFADVDDESSCRSTPIRLNVGRDSLQSKHDQSDNAEEQSRPSSVVASRRRRQSMHDQHRSVPVRQLPSHENSRDSSRNNSFDCEATILRKQLSSCQQELEELKEKYRELDEECEICAQYLRERDDQCVRLKKEKLALEAAVADLKGKLSAIPNASQSNVKKKYAHASVNTDEDWANLHSVVVDRMSYNAEVEKNKKQLKTIEELRFKNQDLKTTMSKMQKALEKYNLNSKELEVTKAELSSCKQELQVLQEKYKELDEECETCAEYLRERDEQCRKLKEAKASLEAKLEEYQELSNTAQSVRKKRRTLHDQNRPPVSTSLNDASTETSDDFLSYQVEKDDTPRVAEDAHAKEIRQLKMAVEKLSQQKKSLEHQLITVTSTPVYVATGSAIVQNQQITDVMKENQKLKKMNAKLITICQKRGKSQSDANRENEDPADNVT